MTAQAVDTVLGDLAQQLGAKVKQTRMTQDIVGIQAATDRAIAAGHISEEPEMRMMTQGHGFTHLAACEAGAGAAPHRPDAIERGERRRRNMSARSARHSVPDLRALTVEKSKTTHGTLGRIAG